MTGSILIHDDAHVRTITINRPDRMNALNRPAAQALLDAIAETRERAEIGVVILTAAGDRAFCTGADVKEFTVGSGYDGASWTGIGLPMEEIQLAIRALPQPVIAAAIDREGTTFRDYQMVNGESGRNADFLVAYGQEGLPCVRCGTAMRKVVLAQRGTTYCPSCQRP